jgi:hypothetical protein
MNGSVPGAAFSTDFELMDVQACAGASEDLGASLRDRCGVVRAPIGDDMNAYVCATIPEE